MTKLYKCGVAYVKVVQRGTEYDVYRLKGKEWDLKNTYLEPPFDRLFSGIEMTEDEMILDML